MGDVSSRPVKHSPKGSLIVWTVGLPIKSRADVKRALTHLRRRFRVRLRHLRIHIVHFRLTLTALRRARGRGPRPHIALLTPSLATWSRLPAAGRAGPKAVRSRTWPWGLPWLSKPWRQRCEADNSRLRHLLQLFELLALSRDAPTVIDADTEDIGDAKVSTASAWQLPELALVARAGGLQRYACYQCWLGQSARPRPTAFLLNFCPPTDLIIGPSQWPQYHVVQGKAVYDGPLQLPCGCGRWHKQLKRDIFTTSSFSSSPLFTFSTLRTLFTGALKHAVHRHFELDDLLQTGEVNVGELELTDAEETAPAPTGAQD